MEVDDETEPKDLSTGLVDCEDETGTVVEDNVVYFRTTLGGEEGNVFQWTKNLTASGLPSGDIFCIRIPQTSQCIGGVLTQLPMPRKSLSNLIFC